MTGTRALWPLAAGLLLLLAGCGWMEWPPHSSGPRATAGPPPSGFAAASVTAASGDTVYDIARRHRVSVRAVIEANRLKPPYRLRAGQRLVLPRPRTHLVKRGDTLYGISRRYRVGMYALARANGLGPPYTILVNQRLRLPGAAGAPSPPPKAPPKPAGTARKTAPPKKSAVLPAPSPKPPPPAIPAPPASSGKGFLWPVRGKVVSGFGPKAKGLHNDGVNIAARRGAPVRAAENGVIAYAGTELRGFGNLLLVKHDNGWITAYAHTQDLAVKRGQRVKKGQVIARVGSTGNVSTPQLHFEMRRGKRAVDPVKYLKT